MEKTWLTRYPSNVPADIDTQAYPSLVAMFEAACARYSERPAYSNLGQTLSFSALEQRSRAVAAYLQQELGLQRGERVAIMLPNLLSYPVALFGILRAGLTVVNVNPLYTPRELQHQLQDCGARCIIILSNFAHTLQQVRADTPLEHILIAEAGDLLPWWRRLVVNFVLHYVKKQVPAYQLPGARSFQHALQRGEQLSLQPVELGHDDLAFLQYTGGTTGVSKGAMLSHGNMIANMEQTAAYVGPVLEWGQETVITALPLYHVFCLTVNCLCFAKLGGHNILITNPRDMPSLIQELGRWRFSVITGVNTLFNAMVHNSEFAKLDFSHLKLAVGGGMAVQAAVAERWQQLTGKHLLEGYGLTEASPVVTVNPTDLSHYSGSIGLPLPSTEICLRDDQGREVPAGQAGELCVRGPQVMRGYWQRDDETAKIIDAQGWLQTGDVARMDEHGFFYLVDRKKDMILVSGFNVYPNEIEGVLASCPGVLEAACIGVPDDKSGEAVKVFIVPKPGAELTLEQVREFCRANLTGYKIPRHVEFRRDLPKSNVGKILRRELR